MKNIRKILFRSALFALVLAGSTQATGFITPIGSQESLDLTAHQVNAVVQHGFAVTGITQAFSNPHARDIEAVYPFPVPDRASVSEFTDWIAGQPVYVQRAAVDPCVGRYLYPLEDANLDAETDASWTRNDTVATPFSFRFHLRSAQSIYHLDKDLEASLNRLQAGGLETALRSIDRARTSAVAMATDGVTNAGTTTARGVLKLVDSVDLRISTAVTGSSAKQTIQSHLQDTLQPAFPSQRLVALSTGGGSLGCVLLLILAVLAGIRLLLEVRDRVVIRSTDADEDTA